jgi:hypothetical protein
MLPHRRRASVALIALSVSALLLSACGSSKPAYCSSVSNLQKSVKSLSNFNIQSGPSAFVDDVKAIAADAKSVVSNAKSDFPSETSALSSSVNALANSAKQVSASPSRETITALASEVPAVINSAKNLQNATSSKCG